MIVDMDKKSYHNKVDDSDLICYLSFSINLAKTIIKKKQ